uniref:Bacterial repeat domain-containing protein n=1 Tax=Thermofilum adornatum TaxID=1365176 RepID=A0A7C1GQ78_9CREN
MQRKTLLVALIIGVVLALALFFFVLQPKVLRQTPVQTQPVVNTTQPQQAQNVAQPKTKLLTIIATIEASQGGRVLVNGTETTSWNSTGPFILVLEAVPERCMALDYWLINNTIIGERRLSLTIAGNTTIKAFFTKPWYTLIIKANATGAAVQINSDNYTLPASISVPACNTVEVKPLETPLYKPLNNTLKITVSSDTNIMLYYRQKSINSIQILINGKPREVEVRKDPFVKSIGTIETTSDGLIHIKGTMYIYIYVPWNFTRVIVQADIKPLSDSKGFNVGRYCEWGADPFAYYKSFYDVTRVEFQGCRPFGVSHYGYVSGKRYDYEKPGAIFIDAINVEAWVKIEAYP